jgi:hypothetical protein
MNIELSKYVVPTLGTFCAIGAIMVVSGMRIPFTIDAESDGGAGTFRVPENLVLDDFIPTMEDVVAKHLFVPERAATGENAFPDLVVKGVYVGTQRNAVFSLKSKPIANLRVWQGDEEAALMTVEHDRDPRKPIVDFLSEWQIKEIDFSGVTVEHLITGEVETYAVDYTPEKKIKDSAQSGYGQGFIADTSTVSAKAPSTKTAAQARPGQQNNPSGFSPQAAAGRVGAFMQRMSPQQRQQFMQQLQKQQGGAKQNTDTAQKGKNTKTTKNGGGGGRKKNR